MSVSRFFHFLNINNIDERMRKGGRLSQHHVSHFGLLSTRKLSEMHPQLGVLYAFKSHMQRLCLTSTVRSQEQRGGGGYEI